MKARVLFRVLAIFLAVLSASPVGAKMLSEYQFSGGWTGGAYVDNTSGEFSHCVASADYESGISLLISVTADYGWNIGLAADGWGLPVGDVELSYRFDDSIWRRGTANIFDPEFALIAMPDDSTIISLFRQSRQMRVAMLGGEYFFNLDGTAKVTIELVECVEAFSGATAPPGGTTAAAAPPTSPQPDTGSSGGSGSGIVITATGYVLTNNHVVNACGSLSVTASGAAARTASLIRTDEANDLALLKVDGFFSVADVATFRTGSPLQAGEVVAVYGYPLAGMLSQSGNIVSGNITALSGLGDDVRFIQISAPVQPGNSGGPLVDASGLVVGVVNARMNDVAVLGATGSLPQNVNFAIRGNVAMNFLDAHSIPYKSANQAPVLTLVEIAAQAKRFGVFVSCEG